MRQVVVAGGVGHGEGGGGGGTVLQTGAGHGDAGEHVVLEGGAAHGVGHDTESFAPGTVVTPQHLNQVRP